MSYHIVNIDANECSLTYRDGQLLFKSGSVERQLPLEDVAAIVLTSFSATIHSSLIAAAAKHGVAFVVCEAFKPVGLLLPANRATDTLLTRAQVGLSAKLKKDLWQRTLDAKCQNQYGIAAALAPGNPLLESFRAMAWGRNPHKESACARALWRILGIAIGQPGFTRDRSAPGFNQLLNYGYGVLLSLVLQKMFALGLDPVLGVSHSCRERSAPLAYDLMEPFRPCVDWRIWKWAQAHPSPESWEVSKEFRAWATQLAILRVDHDRASLSLQGVVETVLRSFRRALLEKDVGRYKPWTLKNSKWAG